MESRAHTRRPRSQSVTRIVAAAALTLALLAGAVPLEGVASARLCTMSCCAGRTPHAEGSCTHGACQVEVKTRPVVPEKKSEESEKSEKSDSHCGSHDSSRTQDAEKQDDEAQRDETRDDVSHTSGAHADGVEAHHAHDAPEDSSARARTPNSRKPVTSVAASAFTGQCPPGCGAASFGYMNQSRPRAAALSHATRPRPPSVKKLHLALFDSTKTPDVLCRQCAPRAPPHALS
ncbi:MAG TPA: hypothetical protein VFX96_00865 [Pyrinomonadaceae bacterium]|nr:hypothetical protein [Pyrinomonadaceae bacterium]